jgi:peptide/nickel transport system substrate-binding protein
MTDTDTLTLHERHDRRLSLLAGASILVGVAFLAVSIAWPKLRPERAVVAGKPASVPTIALSAPPTVKAPISTVTTVNRADVTTTLPAALTTTTTAAPKPTTPPSTVKLPPFTVATVPPVSVAAIPRPVDKPIVVGVPYGLTDANPHLTTLLPTDNAAVMSLVLPSTFRTGAKGEAVLDQDLLAEAPKVLSPDPLLVQYVVRPDAAWSDGTPIGCDDFRMAALAGNGRYQQRTASGATVPAFQTLVNTGYQHASIGCQDAKHITVSFDIAVPDWKWLFRSMIPAHIVMAAAKVTDLTTLDDPGAIRVAAAWNSSFSVVKELPATVVSGGPFKLANISTDGALLVANEKFWATRPLAKAGVLVKAVPVAGQLDAVRSGSVQVAALAPDEASLAAIRTGSGVTLSRSAPVALTELVMNFGKPELQQRALRDALNACIDRTSLMTGRVLPVLADATAADNRLFAPSDIGYRKTDAAKPVGVEAAAALLTKLGYSKSAKTGVMEKGGRPLSLTLYYDPAGSLGRSVAEAIASQCAPAGVVLVPTPNAGDVVDSGPWDLAILTGAGDQSLANRLARYTQADPADIGRYGSAKIAPLAQQAASAPTEVDQTAVLNQIDEALWADVATVPLYRAPSVAMAISTVTGVVATPGAAGVLGSARLWQ